MSPDSPARSEAGAILLWTRGRAMVAARRGGKESSVVRAQKTRVGTAVPALAYGVAVRGVVYSSFFLRLRIMSSVIFSRSYWGFQPHSLRAQLSSILSGQLSAMACLIGSGS